MEQGAILVLRHLPYWALEKKEAGSGKSGTCNLITVWEKHLTNKAEDYLCSSKCFKQKAQPFPQKSHQVKSFILWFSLLCNHLLLPSAVWQICTGTYVSACICHCLWAFRKCFCLMQALDLCAKARHCLVLGILLHYLHAGFYSESHFVFSSLFFFFFSIANNSYSLLCKLSPLSHYIIFLPKLLCSPTLNNLVSPKPGFTAVF